MTPLARDVRAVHAQAKPRPRLPLPPPPENLPGNPGGNPRPTRTAGARVPAPWR